MTETHDLVPRLLAAIEETERDALWAAHPGQWASWESILNPQAVGLDGKTRLERIAAAILRHCTLDRKIVNLHTPERSWVDDTMRCRTCHDESWILNEGEGSDGTVYQEAQWQGESHPCATLRALAEGYGLTEQQGGQP